MSKICPLCNGLLFIEESCPKCGSKLLDVGIVEAYFAPYNEYLDWDILESTFQTEKKEPVARDTCLHLFKCEVCGWDHRFQITKVRF